MSVAADAAAAPRRRRWVLVFAGLVVLPLLAGLIALGTWQLKRLAWKQDLLARVERLQQAAPVPAPGPAEWGGLTRNADEYRRVQVRGRFVHELESLVRASTVLGSGYWVLTPLQTDGGEWLLVNRGFVPPEQRARETRAATEPRGPQQVTGLLRLSEPGGSLLQANDPAAGRWYSRDVQAMADAHALGGAQRPGAVAPFFIDTLADPAAPEAWPRGGLTVLSFSNNHRVYALTWFTLAAMLAAAVLYLLRQEGWLGGRGAAGARDDGARTAARD